MLSIYLDKVLVASANSTLVLGINPGSPGRLTIGANDIGGFWFDGTVDRVRLSAKALTPDQFFAMGTVAPGNPLRITTPLADQTVSAGSTVTLKVVADGPAPLTYSWSLNGAPIPGATSDTLSLNNVQPSQSGNYAVTVTSGSCIAPQGAAAWWSAEGDAVDRVGGNNGTLQNGAGFDTGEVGSGFKLDGVDDQVVVPDSPSLAIGAGQDFSIEGWIKTSGGGPNDIAIIFEKRTNPDAFTAVGISLYLLGGRLGAQLADQPLAANHFSSYWSSGPDLRDGQFHHVAMSVTRNAANGGKL
jgi:hypothetical protein